MPNIGGPEIIIIFVVILLLFGAKKIPELARGLGKSMGEFKKARNEFEDEMRRAVDVEDESAKKEKKPRNNTPSQSQAREEDNDSKDN